MAGTLISFPAEETSDWTNHIDMFKDLILGYIQCSLTEWDTGTVPQLAAGSKIELNGSYITFGSNESITGSPSSGYINYIYLDSAAYTLSWSTTAPTWSDAKQGWYNSDDRCLGGCYYDGTYYTEKWIYAHGKVIRGSDLVDDAITAGKIAPSGVDADSLGDDASFENAQTGYLSLSLDGVSITFSGNTTIYPPCNIVNGAIVKNLYSFAEVPNGTITVNLCRSHVTGQVEQIMATNAHSGGGALNDNSISYATIDNTNYSYYFKIIRANHTNIAYLDGLVVTYTIVKPIP